MISAASLHQLFSRDRKPPCIVPRLVALLALACSTVNVALAEFAPLFNGVDLDGWHVVGGNATFEVENGEVVGRSLPNTPNTFLVTDQPFDDFVLELEFRILDANFNSGVQLRSDSDASHNGGRLYGYQVEFDPSSRAWTGGLYFEGGSPDRPAGWLDDLDDNPSAREAYEPAEWNHIRVVARGRRLSTWVNDVQAVDYFDFHTQAFLSTGVIGLQVHSNPSATPLEVRWKNVRIEGLEPGPNLTVGDFNGDGSVGLADYRVLVANLNRDAVGLSAAEAYLFGDINGDARIDYADFVQFRSISPAIASQQLVLPVPEPTAGILLVILGAGLLNCSSRDSIVQLG